MAVKGRFINTSGKPIPGALIDVWQTNDVRRKRVLIADFKKVDSLKQAQKLGFDGPFWSVEWDFTLAEATKSSESGHSKQATGEA